MKGLVLSTLIGCALSLSWRDEVKSTDLEQLDLKSEFKDWATTFEKSYPDIDEEFHRYLFKKFKKKSKRTKTRFWM